MTNPGWTMIHQHLVPLLLLLILPVAVQAQTESQFEQARHRMVEEVVAGAGVKDPRVLQAIRDTPRHEFVAPNLRQQAYFDMALPIGFQQTISSPFIVAYMTESLDPQPTDKVLEIGTGSGYQAAVLSPLVKEVYSIEIVEGLGRKAERTLKHLKYKNVFTKVGDGFKGWEEHAPFDKIIVTCSPEGPPQPLIDQLAEGGLMVIPAGQRYQQTLYLMRKKDGKLEKEALRPTLFVPMTGTAEDLRRVKPDPANPQAANGNFEEEVGENGFIPGWYYQRQAERTADTLAPEGEHYVTFKNEEVGRASHLLQGLPIDGREVAEIELSAFVKYSNISVNLGEDALPSVGITFYDENRNDLGHNWIGPFRGSSEWTRVKKQFRVPIQAREGLLRIGLFGATGELSFDSVTLKPIPR